METSRVDRHFTDVTTTVPVTEQQVKGLLCDAFENGARYWASISGYEFAPGLTKADFHDGGRFATDAYNFPAYLVPFVDGCAVLIHDDEEGKVYRLDRAALEKGLRLMAEKQPRHWADFINENDDGDTGDCFLQLALLGEVVYG